MTLSLTNAIPVAERLPRPRLRQRTRVRCLFLGAALTALGLVAPWFIVLFRPPGGGVVVDGVVHTNSTQWVDMFNFRSIDISHGWVTITPYNSHLWVGLHAVEGLVIISVALGITTLLGNHRWFNRVSPHLRLAGSILIKLVHVLAIIAFVRLLWWGTTDGHFQYFVRDGVYQTFDGGRVGATIASFCTAGPFVGLFFTVLGLVVSAAGIYTSDSTPAWEARKRATGAFAGKVTRVATGTAVLAAILLFIFLTVVGWPAGAGRAHAAAPHRHNSGHRSSRPSSVGSRKSRARVG